MHAKYEVEWFSLKPRQPQAVLAIVSVLCTRITVWSPPSISRQHFVTSTLRDAHLLFPPKATRRIQKRKHGQVAATKTALLLVMDTYCIYKMLRSQPTYRLQPLLYTHELMVYTMHWWNKNLYSVAPIRFFVVSTIQTTFFGIMISWKKICHVGVDGIVYTVYLDLNW